MCLSERRQVSGKRKRKVVRRPKYQPPQSGSVSSNTIERIAPLGEDIDCAIDKTLIIWMCWFECIDILLEINEIGLSDWTELVEWRLLSIEWRCLQRARVNLQSGSLGGKVGDGTPSKTVLTLKTSTSRTSMDPCPSLSTDRPTSWTSQVGGLKMMIALQMMCNSC